MHSVRLTPKPDVRDPVVVGSGDAASSPNSNQNNELFVVGRVLVRVFAFFKLPQL